MNVYLDSKVVTCAWVQQYQENLIEIDGVPQIIKSKGSDTIRCFYLYQPGQYHKTKICNVNYHMIIIYNH